MERLSTQVSLNDSNYENWLNAKDREKQSTYLLNDYDNFKQFERKHPFLDNKQRTNTAFKIKRRQIGYDMLRTKPLDGDEHIIEKVQEWNKNSDEDLVSKIAFKFARAIMLLLAKPNHIYKKYSRTRKAYSKLFGKCRSKIIINSFRMAKIILNKFKKDIAFQDVIKEFHADVLNECDMGYHDEEGYRVKNLKSEITVAQWVERNPVFSGIISFVNEENRWVISVIKEKNDEMPRLLFSSCNNCYHNYKIDEIFITIIQQWDSPVESANCGPVALTGLLADYGRKPLTKQEIQSFYDKLYDTQYKAIEDILMDRGIRYDFKSVNVKNLDELVAKYYDQSFILSGDWYVPVSVGHYVYYNHRTKMLADSFFNETVNSIPFRGKVERVMNNLPFVSSITKYFHNAWNKIDSWRKDHYYDVF